MDNKQKLERASQLRREAMALEDEVMGTTPKCSRCMNLFTMDLKKQVFRCGVFNGVVPAEYTQVDGNGCESYSWDSVPFSFVAHENH